VVWERAPPTPWCAAAAPRVDDAPRPLDSATTPSSDARQQTACRCLADPTKAFMGDSLHSPPAPASRRLTGATRPGRTAGPYGAADAPVRSTLAWPQGASPAFFFRQSNSTVSCPICWDNWAWNASWSRSRLSRRPEKMSGSSCWRRWFPWALCGGGTPEVLASSLTVVSPLSASSATRALHSALYCFRCVDLDPLLLSLSYGHSMLS
jgi:hypothetical protein